MRAALDARRIPASAVAAWFLPAILFWSVLAFPFPFSFTKIFHRFIPVVFLGVLFLFYGTFRLKGAPGILTGFGLAMLLFALTLSYLWTSGFSDNFLIGGLLPYKDAKNYYLGANLLLHGLPIRVAGQAVGRPLFPGFLSSLLWLTGQNLKVTVALLAQLAGVGLYLCARQVRQAMGAFAGAIFITFLYFYFQRFVGYAMSESLGFLGGCFGFALLWRAAETRKWFDLLLGLGLLLVAVSARAGSFFIFPMLALWAGWLFRGTKRFSVAPVTVILAILLAGYGMVNAVYPRLVGVPEGSSFGNFAYTLYGQVRGGTGWHSAIDELGTRNTSRVYQAAWNEFLANPSGFARGSAKAYADFFLPGAGTIFAFDKDIPSWILWAFTMLILLRGLYGLVFKLRSNLSTLLLAGFGGIFLSIPFLPPVDGGNRFYASTMPFFFVLLAAGVSRFTPDDGPATAKNEAFFLHAATVSLLALSVLLPPVTLRLRSLPTLRPPVCSPDQRPFVIRVQSGSYIDLVQDRGRSCGLAPNLCYDDFLEHNSEMQIDDFYQELGSLVSESQTGVRIIPTVNQLDGYFQYFVTTDREALDSPSDGLVSGCASRILTENQRIFRIESFSASNK